MFRGVGVSLLAVSPEGYPHKQTHSPHDLLKGMYTVLLILLYWHSLSHPGEAFAPPSSPVLLKGRGERNSGTFLFNPEGGDHRVRVTKVSPSSGSKKAAEEEKVATESGGGWGTWEKQVSQRVEQDQVLERFTAEGGIPADASLAVRTVNKSDMFDISR